MRTGDRFEERKWELRFYNKREENENNSYNSVK